MQSAKKAAETAKETAANIGASAKSGMDKTKATVQENTEKMTAHTPMEKEMATQKKEERIREAELEKQKAREQNAASRQAATAPGGRMGTNYTTTGTGSATYSTTGDYGEPMGGHQMSAMPGHGMGHPVGGHVTEGTVGSHSVGTDRGSGRTIAHDTPVEGNATGYGTGHTGGGSS